MDEFRFFPVITPEPGVVLGGYNLIDTDPQGSYTGRPADPEEKPVQDADDL